MAPGTTPAQAHERALEALLAQLESPSADARSIAAAGERCAQLFERLRADGGALPATARARRLLAVLLDVCARERDRSGQRLELARSARRAFRGLSSGEPGGHACDCAG